MTVYFKERDSIRVALGENDRQILEVLVGRYVGANAPVPFALRPFNWNGILQDENGLYEMALSERLPYAKSGDYAYVYGRVWSDDRRELNVIAEPLGPLRINVNGERVYASEAVDELNPGARVVLPLIFREGWNEVLIEARKTEAGFGCLFGAEEAKVRILQVLAPFAERAGHAGWIYSEPVKRPLYGPEEGFPDGTGIEEFTGTFWHPRLNWTAEELGHPNCERLFGEQEEGAAALAWTRIELPPAADGKLLLEGAAMGPLTLWLGAEPVFVLEHGGVFRAEVLLDPGMVNSPDLLVHISRSSTGWGFDLSASLSSEPLRLKTPVHVQGEVGPWLYAGPLLSSASVDPRQVCTPQALFSTTAITGGKSHTVQTTWQVDLPDTCLRLYYENAVLSSRWTAGSATNFGRWDYPLGVTMYGLLRTARELKRQDLLDYALAHIRACTDLYDYARLDRERFGFPAVNHQLVLIRMLDNCGSFGSAMLEAYGLTKDSAFLRIARDIAEFILHRLERRPDGAFYRECPGEYSADTMWADDLYMSVPFLIRYAEAAEEPAALDEAVRQCLLFRSYLFMEEEQLMSHVFDFKYGKLTRVPWGRGNGWVLFSLSELLERLPIDHDRREDVLEMFRSLCEGAAAVQGASGMWRQVLNQTEAYEEASCTAMFAYAFARGVRYEWLSPEKRQMYTAAALKAWRGLTERAIDRRGNVHGVCSGSRYSFLPDYYMYDLRTVLNDNHGIGITMLAGVEIRRLKETQSAASISSYSEADQ